MNAIKRTIVLKLYKPSARKKRIIDEAMTNYTEAFQYLLDKAQGEISTIEENFIGAGGKYRPLNIAKWFTGEIGKELNQFGVEPFKDSIRMDFSTVIAGWLNLKKSEASVRYPLADKEKAPRPIFFCRYSVKRNYSLLYNAENDRYYAKIYLLNARSDNRAQGVSSDSPTLTYIDKNRQIFKESGGKRTYLIFPLSFGRWQEGYLKRAIEKPEILKTAVLAKKKDEYFLYINIEEEGPEIEEPMTYMGICRGLDSAVHYSVVDREGILVTSRAILGECEAISNARIHEMTNMLLRVAKEHKSQVIMEKLVNIGDRLNWTEKDGTESLPILSCLSYNELFNILEYKLPGVGIQPPVRVSGVGVFYTCIHCGNGSKSNRFTSKRIICTQCGRTSDIEATGSMNMARKLIKYDNDPLVVRAEDTPSGVKFVNEELSLEYYPSDPFACAEEFRERIHQAMEDFYMNISEESKKSNFKRKYSSVKKLERCRTRYGDIFKGIVIE